MTSTLRTVIAVILAASTASTSSARASIIFDNVAVPVNTFSSSDATTLVRAEDFILAPGASTVTGVQWTGIYAGAMLHADDDFTIQFLANLPGTPDEPDLVSNAIVSIAVANPNRTGAGLFSYSATIAPLALTPGVKYWVSIFNNASDETGTPVWAWGGTNVGVTSSDIIGIRNMSDFWGNGIGFRQDFQLQGDITVPEAASLVMWSMLGVVGMMLKARFVPRKRRA